MARGEEFLGEASRVRDPFAESRAKFNAMSQQRYTPTSVLDQAGPSGIGMAAEDRTRLLVNGDRLPSPMGVSASTYERRLSMGMESNFQPRRS